MPFPAYLSRRKERSKQNRRQLLHALTAVLVAGAAPAIGALIGKLRGANDPALPPYVVLNHIDRTHFAWGGWLGKQHDPFVGDKVDRLLHLPAGLSLERLRERRTLSRQIESIQCHLDQTANRVRYPVPVTAGCTTLILQTIQTVLRIGGIPAIETAATDPELPESPAYRQF